MIKEKILNGFGQNLIFIVLKDVHRVFVFQSIIIIPIMIMIIIMLQKLFN